MRRFAIGSLTTLVIALVLGFLISQALTGFLAIRFLDKDVPAETATVVDSVTPEPLASIGSLDIPGDDPLFEAASRTLREAVSARDVSGGSVDVHLEVTDGEPDSFTISSDGSTVVVTGSRTGVAQGFFRMASRIRAGHGWESFDGMAEAPALKHRFVDTGGAGITTPR